MGNPLYDDEVGKMCFNPAKSFQLGWYPENVQTLDLGVGDMWQGQLVGVADYLNNPDNNKIVMKLETGTNEDYFVGFNRATGINSQNDHWFNAKGSSDEKHDQSKTSTQGFKIKFTKDTSCGGRMNSNG